MGLLPPAQEARKDAAERISAGRGPATDGGASS
ncbi:MAG: hypothetical protein QOJ14_1643, partial [Thermoleophilaceae bacterium]|nr:hypothetical protein [Thermoleophilaceae bacterium]